VTEKKDGRAAAKLPAEVYRDIAQFAVSQNLTIGAVLVSAWEEYKEAHNIVVPKVTFDPVPQSTKKGRMGVMGPRRT